MIGADRLADAIASLPRRAVSDASFVAPSDAALDFGDKGKRAWFWCDGKWQVGRAWYVAADGAINGMCRDYGPWGSPYPGSAPMETHCAEWLPEEVSWKKPAAQYARDVEAATCRSS